jgi:hypothetical protein
MEDVWSDWELDLTLDSVLRGQGIDRQAAERRPVLLNSAEWALQEGLPLISPQVLVRQLEVQEMRHARLILEGGIRLDGELPSSHLAGARTVTLMLATVGESLESISSDLLQSDLALGLALEGLGIAAVERLALLAANRVEAQARSAGWQASIPLSPGMVGWPAERGQPQILALLDPARVGVRVSSSWVMTPRMSLTQVVGAGPELLVEGCVCDYCSLASVCQYRQKQL